MRVLNQGEIQVVAGAACRVAPLRCTVFSVVDYASDNEQVESHSRNPEAIWVARGFNVGLAGGFRLPL